MKQKNIGYMQIFLAGVSWGLIGLFTNNLSKAGLNSIEISFLRQFSALLAVGGIVLLKYGVKALKLNKDSILLLAAQGCVITVCFCIFYALTIQMLGVATAAIMMYLAPVFVIFFSAILFKEKISGVKILAIVVNLLGCIISTTKGDFDTLSFETLGLLFGVLTGLCYALVSVFGKVFSERGINSFVSVFYICLFSSAVLGVLSLMKPSGVNLLRGDILLNGFGDGLFGTALAYLFYYSGLKKPIFLSSAPVIASVEVVIGALIGIMVFGEMCNGYVIAGIALVIGSIAIINFTE